MSEFIINVEYENEIRKIISETSIKGISLRIKSKKYFHLWNYLKLKYPNIQNDHVTEYLYWFINDLKDFPKCPVCEKSIKGFINFNNGYFGHCSIKCMTNSKIINNKRKLTSIEHFGTESPFQSDEVKDKIKQTCLRNLGVEYAFSI